MNRGDRREATFTDDAGRQRFLDCLGEACARTQWPLHAFCLLPNHFHLVMETPMRNRQQFKGVVKVHNRFCVAARSSMLADRTCQCRGGDCSGRPANRYMRLTG